MRILHVIPGISEQEGGPSQAVVAMCEALIANGIDVLLATTDAHLDINCQPGTEKIFKNVPTVFFPATLANSFKFSWALQRWLMNNVSHFDLVHIHAVFNHSSMAAARACRARKIPYIVRPLGSLDPWGMRQKRFRKLLFWHLLARKMIREAAAIHYTSEGEKLAVEQSLRLDQGVVIPLGVSIEDRPCGNTFRMQYPSVADARYVLVLSRLLRTKGLEELLSAFLSLVKAEQYRSWRLVFAGDGPPEFVHRLKDIVSRNLAAEFVVFTGWLTGEAKQAALRGASLLALPSHHENFGLCVMESLASGVPVLVSRHVNLAQEIQTADAGWICSSDEVSILQTLQEALSSEEELVRRANNGRYLAERYSWTCVTDQLIRLYAQLIARAKVSSATVQDRENCRTLRSTN
jgi:glycosyltransferase involved in cell wall biosynthesis